MNLSSLFFWRKRQPLPRLEHVQIILYTRSGCHLCESAWELLEREQRRYGYVLTSVDVDSEPELTEQYGLQVPVVSVNGRVRFWGAVNGALLHRLLWVEAEQTKGPP